MTQKGIIYKKTLYMINNVCITLHNTSVTLASIASLVFSGRPVEHHEDIKDTIKSLRHEIHKVQYFIDHSVKISQR